MNVNIQTICNADFCISCGACTHICIKKNLQMSYDDYKGKWEPHPINTGKCANCSSVCVSVCPMNRVDYASLFSSDLNNLLGKIESVYTGHSKDPDVRFSSSSGGCIREICSVLINKKIVDGIISLRHCGGMNYEPAILQNADEMPNSIYHNVNFSEAISLIKENTGKYAIIGLPCQLTSIDLFLSHPKNKNLKERCVCKISLICGYSFERVNFIALAAWNNISLASLTYRNGGRYRSFRMTDKDGSVSEFPSRDIPDFRTGFLQKLSFDHFHAQKGCLWCVDHLGYCADIVVGDAWLKKYESDFQGINLLIVRTKKGSEIIAMMDNIELIPGTIEDILESQGVYATGEIGAGMRKHFHHGFLPDHIRINESSPLPAYSLTFKDLMKIKMIKPALRRKQYRLVTFCYLLLEWKMIAYHVIGQIRSSGKSRCT